MTEKGEQSIGAQLDREFKGSADSCPGFTLRGPGISYFYVMADGKKVQARAVRVAEEVHKTAREHPDEATKMIVEGLRRFAAIETPEARSDALRDGFVLGEMADKQVYLCRSYQVTVLEVTFEANPTLRVWGDLHPEFAALRRRAEAGVPSEMMKLADVYERGSPKMGVDRDPRSAAEWRRKGLATATYHLGESLLEEHGVPKNAEEAARRFTEAARGGNADAMFQAGICYAKGVGVDQDYDKAVEWWDRAAKQGHAGAMFNLGRCFDNGWGVAQDQGEAAGWYKRAAEGGHTEAMFNLAMCYKMGDGVKQDGRTAVHWFEQAAVRGDVEAMNNLASCYAKGQGVDEDPAEAVHWFRQAASLGNPVAMGNLSTMYERGAGVAEDIDEAQVWYERAATGGMAFAMTSLVHLYREGHKGIMRNDEDAETWLQKAEEAHRRDGLKVDYDAWELERLRQYHRDLFPTPPAPKRSVEDITYNGEVDKVDFRTHEDILNPPDEEEDDDIKLRWFQRVREIADQTPGSPGYDARLVSVAKRMVGYALSNGIGCTRCNEEANEWFAKAAWMGDAPAMYALAHSFDQGRGVPMNTTRAWELYQQGANAGLAVSRWVVDLESEDHCTRMNAVAELEDTFSGEGLSRSLMRRVAEA